MNIEQMQKIVDGAPDSTATHWVETKLGHYYSVGFQSYFRDGDWHDSDYHTEQELINDYGPDRVFNLADLRAELAKHDTLDLEPADIPHGCIVLEK